MTFHKVKLSGNISLPPLDTACMIYARTDWNLQKVWLCEHVTELASFPGYFNSSHWSLTIRNRGGRGLAWSPTLIYQDVM